MSLLLLIPAAFLAGVLMFLAPCTLPIVPGYLAFIAGVAPGEERTVRSRRRVLRNAFAFVIGFSVVFILLGTFASSLGGLLGPWRELLSRAAGLLLVLFGLVMLGVLQPALLRERRIRIPKFLTIGRPESSALIGALFALGWSPCIGPILGTVLLAASATETVVVGVILLAAFSVGLGIPFILSALFLDQAGTLFTKWGAATVWISRFSGLLLICIGALMALGQMGLFVAWALDFFGAWGYDSLLRYL